MLVTATPEQMEGLWDSWAKRRRFVLNHIADLRLKDAGDVATEKEITTLSREVADIEAALPLFSLTVAQMRQSAPVKPA